MLIQQLSEYKSKKIRERREREQLKWIEENNENNKKKNLLEIDYGNICYKAYCEAFDLYEKKKLSDEEKGKYTDMAFDLFIKFSDIYKMKNDFMEDVDLSGVYNYFLHRAETKEEVLDLIKKELDLIKTGNLKNYLELEDKDFESISNVIGKGQDLYEVRRRYLENLNKNIDGLKFIEFTFKGEYEDLNKAKIDYELSKLKGD